MRPCLLLRVHRKLYAKVKYAAEVADHKRTSVYTAIYNVHVLYIFTPPEQTAPALPVPTDLYQAVHPSHRSSALLLSTPTLPPKSSLRGGKHITAFPQRPFGPTMTSLGSQLDLESDPDSSEWPLDVDISPCPGNLGGIEEI